MSRSRAFSAFLLAPLGVVATFYGPTPFSARGFGGGDGSDIWVFLFVASIMMIVGWIAELTLALPLLRAATRAGRTGWPTTLAIGTLVGALVGLLLVAVSPNDPIEMRFAAICALGGAASAAVHRLIARPTRDAAMRPTAWRRSPGCLVCVTSASAET